MRIVLLMNFFSQILAFLVLAPLAWFGLICVREAVDLTLDWFDYRVRPLLRKMRH